MNWIILIIFIYIAFTTIKYALSVWKDRKKFASVFIMFLSASQLALAVWVLFLK